MDGCRTSPASDYLHAERAGRRAGDPSMGETGPNTRPGEMSQHDLDDSHGSEIMTPEEVARYLRKSCSWVYKHWQVLGGVKLGGSLLFPRKEDLYERLFSQEQGVEIRLHPGRRALHGNLVQDQAGRKARRGRSKGRDPAEAEQSGSQNRHRLLEPGEPKA